MRLEEPRMELRTCSEGLSVGKVAQVSDCSRRGKAHAKGEASDRIADEMRG